MPFKGYKQTEEHRLKIKASSIIAASKRIDRLLLTCSNCNKEFYRVPSHVFTDKVFCSKKCSGANCRKLFTGKKLNLSEKGRQILRDKCKGDKNVFKRPEVRKKLSENHYDCFLDKNPNWQGGKSFELYPIGWSRTHKEQIRNRDGYKCQICGVPEQECLVRLHVHHIDYVKDNIDKNNLISVCNSCHTKTNYNRNVWQELLSNKIIAQKNYF